MWVRKRECGLTSSAVELCGLSGAELVGSGKCRSRGEGGGIECYYTSTAIEIKVMACTGEEGA
jgi:hypothetical protein